ncbi:MAG: hypothetical protein KAY24_05870 [Candidatus Eisenbacteria sp.]|nr:hypothetical protein [Candidatus Eisenbacteria bacterium]
MREAINRKVLLLVAIFLVALTTILGMEEILRVLSARHEHDLANQQACRSLAKVILRELQEVEMNMLRLSLTEDVRDIPILEKQIAAATGDIEAVLSVLENGGEFEDVVPVNFMDADEIRQSIAFERASDAVYVVEVLDLMPKIMELHEYAKAMVGEVHAKCIDPDTAESRGYGRDVTYHLKQTQTLIQRSRECANKIFSDTNIQIEHLESLRERAQIAFAVVRYIVSAIVTVVGVLLFLVIIRQIGGILHERQRVLMGFETRVNLVKIARFPQGCSPAY